ncbi:hypothetical protein HPB49_011494 [Dermacentor silvarum]|uniref:Uncharacterized protein n=1 Tax=Dermacentor silvarum TaxID=543639 RepID=A0ACB8CX12_DERSI|nr:hypothetical protein HPB49_011494 [Dermacentor silvarum]
MSSRDSPGPSRNNESSARSSQGTPAKASPASSVPSDAKQGLEVLALKATQGGGSREKGGQHDGKEESPPTLPPGTVLLETSPALQQREAKEESAAPGATKQAIRRSVSQNFVATVSIGGTSNVPAEANISEASSYVTAECAAKSINPSVSERSSVFQTTPELGAVRGPLYFMLQGESHKPGPAEKQNELPRETTTEVVETKLFSWRSPGDVITHLPVEQTTEVAAETSKRNRKEETQLPTDSVKASDITTPKSVQPASNSESQPLKITSGEESKQNGEDKDASTPPKGKQRYHTEPRFKDWPKREAEIIPDPSVIVFMKTNKPVPAEGMSHPPTERRRSLILTKTTQLISSQPNDQPVYWESLHETGDDASSSQAPVKRNSSSIAGSHAFQVCASDEGASSVATTKAVRRKSIEIKHTPSADAVNVALEVDSHLYSPRSLLNFDKDQIEDPTQKPSTASRTLSPSDNQTSRGGVLSASSNGAPPSKVQSRSSRIFRLTQTLSSLLSDATVRATSRRYWILLTFCTLSMLNAFQWIQYSIIASVIKDHYGVSEATISWTSLLYLIGYMALAFPSAWILDNKGLRATVLIGAVGTAIGACIKTFAVKPGQFTLVLVGQVFPALAQAFILGVPPRLSSAWFKYEEISTACSVGVLGNNLGIALGFVIPPNVVHVDNVETSLLYLCGSVGLASCVCFFIILFAFDDKPEYPPSYSEMLNRRRKERPSFSAAFRTLLTDVNFWLLLLSYGINTGAFYAISTLLNPVILVYFPGEETFAGWLGLALIVSGLVGSWLCGMALDRTGKYKEVTLQTYILSTVGLFAYTFILSVRSHLLSVLGCLFLGFFMTGYIPIGLQLAAEITYPTPEGISSNIMNMSAQAVGFVLILVSSMIQDAYGDVVSNLCLSALLVVGCIMTVQTKAKLKRQEAYKQEVTRRSLATVPSAVDNPAEVLVSSPEDEPILLSAKSPVLGHPCDETLLPGSSEAPMSE